MRHVAVFLGALLLPVPAFALSDSIASYCRTTNNPDACLSSFIANEPYAKELAQFELRYAQERAAVMEQSREAVLPASDPRIDYCLTTRHPQDCIESLSVDLRVRHQEDQLARQREQYTHQHEMQQRQIDAQLEQARIQANGMALFGAGNALINGMNQGFNNMRLPISPAPLAVQPYIPLNPVRPPIHCFSSNPGAMQSTTCY